MILAMLGGTAARAQGFSGATQRVDWTFEAKPTTVAPGQQVEIRFSAAIDDGWKMYAIDSPPPSRGVRIHLDSIPEAFAQQGEVQQTKPKEGYDPNFEKTVRYFEKQAKIRARFAVAETAATGTYEMGGSVEFMVCTDQMCLPPTRKPFTIAVSVEEGASGIDAEAMTTSTEWVTPNAESPPAGSSGGGESKSNSAEASPTDSETAVSASAGGLNAARRGGLWGFLLLAIGAGGAALLTPCVFPMIPLTVSYFTKHSDDRGEAVRMALVYGLSIIVIFTGLGVLMAAIMGAAGAQTIAANPWINLFIGGVFVFFALSLLGLFELRLPSGLLNYVNRQGNERAGYVGVLFMGLTLTLVSFSCTAPFVGGLLAATTGGAWTYPIVGMLAFSATFALPFVLFALFPNGLEALPKSGSWMNVVKVVLGFVELAAALKFLSNADLVWGWNVLSRPLAIAITVVIFALCGMYLLGKLRLQHEPPVKHVGSLRLLVAMAFFGLSLYMMPGLFGAQLGALDAYLPPRQASDPSFVTTSATSSRAAETGNEELDWHVDDIDTAFTAAREQDRAVFIDFTGYTCTNCRDMEANVFTKAEVTRRFKEDFVLLRLYTDGQPKGPEFQRYQLRLTGTTALPTYAIIEPQDEVLIDHASGTMSVDAFVAFLQRGASSFADQKLAAR